MDIYLAKAKFIYGDDGIIIPSLEAKQVQGKLPGTADMILPLVHLTERL